MSPARPDLPMLTQRLVLRAFEADDVDALFAFERREDVARYLYDEPRTRQEVTESLARRRLMVGFDEEATPCGWRWCCARRARST